MSKKLSKKGTKMGKNIETERKFLIQFPNMETLLKVNLCQTKNIEQTYLISDGTSSRRVRKISVNNTEKYVYTKKTRISEISCVEEENEISNDEYTALLKEKNTSLSTITKTRYAFPFKHHTIEVDIYPFWNDRAILEIELSDEDESFEIPDFLQVIKDVSSDKRYKNVNLAREIVNECIK